MVITVMILSTKLSVIRRNKECGVASGVGITVIARREIIET